MVRPLQFSFACRLVIAIWLLQLPLCLHGSFFFLSWPCYPVSRKGYALCTQHHLYFWSYFESPIVDASWVVENRQRGSTRAMLF